MNTPFLNKKNPRLENTARLLFAFQKDIKVSLINTYLKSKKTQTQNSKNEPNVEGTVISDYFPACNNFTINMASIAKSDKIHI